MQRSWFPAGPLHDLHCSRIERNTGRSKYQIPGHNSMHIGTNDSLKVDQSSSKVPRYLMQMFPIQKTGRMCFRLQALMDTTADAKH